MNAKELNSLVRDIILKAPHWGLILATINRHIGPNTPDGIKIDTACVYLNGINMHMVVNPEFMSKLPRKQKLYVLMHELLHIAFLHPTMTFANKVVRNIACDLQINQILDNIPWLEVPMENGKRIPLSLEDYNLQNYRDKGSHWYYDYLLKQNPSPPPDSHPAWYQFDGMGDSEKRVVKANTQRQIARALSTNPKLIGKLPGSLSEMINDVLFPKPSYNWKKLFRNAVSGYAQTTYLRTTRKRNSVRFPGMPGNRIKNHRQILCAVDTSGSIGKDELVTFFSEINAIVRKTKTGVDVIEFDTKVQDFYKYRSLTQISNKPIKGRGGTHFNPPVEFVNARSNKYNALIYLTDGYGPIPSIKTMVPIIWVLSPTGKSLDDYQDYPGIKIKIK